MLWFDSLKTMSDESSSHENLLDLTLYESLQNKSAELAIELEKHVASIQQKMENVIFCFLLGEREANFRFF